MDLGRARSGAGRVSRHAAEPAHRSTRLHVGGKDAGTCGCHCAPGGPIIAQVPVRKARGTIGGPRHWPDKLALSRSPAAVDRCPKRRPGSERQIARTRTNLASAGLVVLCPLLKPPPNGRELRTARAK